MMNQPTAIRVLIVDDEFPIRVSLGGYLQDRDFEVFSAESAEEAFGVLERQTVDCIVVDLRLPGLDGNALIARAREMQPAVKFLIHTGSVNYQLPPALKKLGLSSADVFYKPLDDMQVLVDAIRRQVCHEDEKDAT